MLAPVACAAAAWVAAVGPVSLVNGKPVASTGTAIIGAPDLMPALAVPGLACRDLIQPDGVTTWTLDGIPSAAEVRATIGVDAAAFLAALAALWDKAAGTGFWTDYQVQRVKLCIAAGVVAFPASARAVSNLSPGIAAPLAAPAFKDQAAADRYNAIVAEFQKAIGAYLRRQYAAAAAAAQVSAQSAAVWDAVYATVEAVRDAPATVAGAVSDSVLAVAGGILGRAWPLLLLAAGGAALWFFWPRLLGAAVKARHAQG